MLTPREWLDPLGPMPAGTACWYCKEHEATIGFWETTPSGTDISHGVRPRPACACCSNRKGLEYAKAVIEQQQARIPLLEAELAKECGMMEVR